MGDKRNYIHIMGIPKGEGKENRIESIFKAIVAKTFPNPEKTLDPKDEPMNPKDAK